MAYYRLQVDSCPSYWVKSFISTDSFRMRKLTPRFANWLRHRQRSVQRQLRRARRRHEMVEIVSVSGVFQTKASSKAQKMPSVLSFEENGPETLAALADVRRGLAMPLGGSRNTNKYSKHRNARPRWMGRYSNFEAIEKITPGAALVLAAEFSRPLHLSGAPGQVINAHKWRPEVLETLWDIGFFDIVGLPQNLAKPDMHAPIVVVPMKTGHMADGAAVTDLINSLRALYPGTVGEVSEANMTRLYGAMIEGIVNVVRHAYPEGASYPYRPTRHWFMTGAVDRSRGWTTAVIYDQGITIPLTLPNWQNYRGYARRIAARLGLVPHPNDPKSDGYAIAAAVEESVSSTGEAHRGQGLAQMRDFVNQCRDGYLRLMSRQGEVVFRNGRPPEIKTHDVSIGGTLIEWGALL